MDEEEKRFARLQTAVQILLGLCLASIALAGVFLVAGEQSNNPTFFDLTYFFGILAIVTVIARARAIKKYKYVKPIKR